jgi:antagonist of KipI
MSRTKQQHPQISVVKPGWFTTVQDLGRRGYQQYGVSVSGAMDPHAHILANRLVGNPDEEATLEITLKGPELYFHDDTVVAITGADLAPSATGINIPLWTSLLIRAGTTLKFGARRAGARSYLSIAGGFDVPIVLGSRATHVSSCTGGLQGRALQAGDLLTGGLLSRPAGALAGRTAPIALRPSYSNTVMLRILPGPHEHSFAYDALTALTAQPYRLSSRSNRMGYRLEGPALVPRKAGQDISEGTAGGALQVPPDGHPILLMADRQTTGGYPTLAVVISADLSVAGQLVPGDTISFRRATRSYAYRELRAQWSELDDMMPPYRPPVD